MSEKTASDIELQFTAGEKISTFLSFSLDQEFTDPLDRLSFSFAPEEGRSVEFRELFQPGELCKCFINGALQATNIIVDLNESGGEDGVIFEVTAESLLTIPMESDVDPGLSKRFKQDTKISTVVEDVMAPFGLFGGGVEVNAHLDVAARAGRAIPGASPNVTLEPLKEKEAQSKDGEKAYPFCSRFISRHGVQLRLTGTGRLLLTKPNYDQEAASNLIQGATVAIEGTRVLSEPKPQIRNTNKGQFSHLLVRGKKRDGDKQTRVTEPYAFLEVPGTDLPLNAPFQRLKRTTLPDTRANYRPGIALYKPKYWRDDEATDQVRCSAKAHLMHGVRASVGFQVTVTVDGFLSHTNRLWTFDTIARVVMQDHDIDEDMWIRRTSKSDSKEDGQKTTITLIPKNSLIIGTP